jgi:hypothetical protein
MTVHKSSRMTRLAVHPQAVQQPTAMGRILCTLKAWRGLIYVGYGDYSQNTGPIAITPFDPSTALFRAPELADNQTEAIGLFRVLGDALYVPSTDPRGLASTDYAVCDAMGWRQVQAIGALHAFDMATLGSDLWLVGAKDTDAVAWRSLDNGATWTREFTVIPPTGYSWRIYAAGVFNKRLYVQVDGESSSHVYDPASSGDTAGWSSGPYLGSCWHPEEFAGRMVYLLWGNVNVPKLTSLCAFDGKVVKTVGPAPLYDYTIDGDTLYGLGGKGVVYATADLARWARVSSAPASARSIVTLGGRVHAGTTDSAIYG